MYNFGVDPVNNSLEKAVEYLKQIKESVKDRKDLSYIQLMNLDGKISDINHQLAEIVKGEK